MEARRDPLGGTIGHGKLKRETKISTGPNKGDWRELGGMEGGGREREGGREKK